MSSLLSLCAYCRLHLYIFVLLFIFVDLVQVFIVIIIDVVAKDVGKDASYGGVGFGVKL